MTDWVSEPVNRFASLLAADFAILLQPDMLLRMVLLLFLFVASAFFSGSETALFSLSRMHLRQIGRERNPQSDALHALLNQPRRLIISILCGNQIVNIAATANLTSVLISLYGIEQAAWISTVLMVPPLLLFGAATPKTIAVSDPVRISSRIVAPLMRPWVGLVAPLTAAVRAIADRITTAIVGPVFGSQSSRPQTEPSYVCVPSGCRVTETGGTADFKDCCGRWLACGRGNGGRTGLHGGGIFQLRRRAESS
jgi:hypothetical protein